MPADRNLYQKPPYLHVKSPIILLLVKTLLGGQGSIAPIHLLLKEWKTFLYFFTLIKLGKNKIKFIENFYHNH